MPTNFTQLDWMIVIGYFTLLVVFAIGASGQPRSSRDYFLGKNEIPWWAAMLSILSTEISSMTAIGYPGLAYPSDWHIAQLLVGFILGRFVVALFFIRTFYRTRVVTVYSFLARRFGNASRYTAALLFCVGRVAASAAGLLAACVAVKLATGIPETTTAIAMGLVALACTLYGGLRSAVWTNCILGVTFTLGGLVTVWVLLSQIDGNLADTLEKLSLGDAFGSLVPDRLPSDTLAGASWIEFLGDNKSIFAGISGGLLLTLATHGTGQDFAQRTLSCPSAGGGVRSLIGSTLLLIPLMALFLVIGSLLFHFQKQNTDLGAGVAANPIDLFPLYVARHLPVGVTGFLLVSLVAATLSGLTASLTGLASTTISDFYRPMVKSPRRVRHLLFMARLATAGCGAVIVLATVSLLDCEVTLLAFASRLRNYFFGALLGAFLLGIFTKRGTQATTTAGMIASVLVVLHLQLRVFLDNPREMPAFVASFLQYTPTGYVDAVGRYVPHLSWPLWVILGTAVCLGIGALRRRERL